VGVVGHEAVRNWRELFVGGGTQDLRHLFGGDRVHAAAHWSQSNPPSTSG
jgi:hypothetical protein